MLKYCRTASECKPQNASVTWVRVGRLSVRQTPRNLKGFQARRCRTDRDLTLGHYRGGTPRSSVRRRRKTHDFRPLTLITCRCAVLVMVRSIPGDVRARFRARTSLRPGRRRNTGQGRSASLCTRSHSDRTLTECLGPTMRTRTSAR